MLSVTDQDGSLVMLTPGTSVHTSVEPDALGRKAFRKSPRCFQLECPTMVCADEIGGRHQQHLQKLLPGYVFVYLFNI